MTQIDNRTKINVRFSNKKIPNLTMPLLNEEYGICFPFVPLLESV